jgi:hypothetical protein
MLREEGFESEILVILWALKSYIIRTSEMLKEKVVYGSNVRHFGDSRWCTCNILNVKGERWYIGEILATVR